MASGFPKATPRPVSYRSKRRDELHVLDEQSRHPLAIAVGGARLAPELRHVGGERKDACPLFLVEHGPVVLAPLLVSLLSFAVCPQLAIPFSLQLVGDQAIVRVDLHVAPTRQLGLVAGSFDLP